MYMHVLTRVLGGLQAFVLGLCDQALSDKLFKNHVRDFLVTMKEFECEDNTALFVEGGAGTEGAAGAEVASAGDGAGARLTRGLCSQHVSA